MLERRYVSYTFLAIDTRIVQPLRLCMHNVTDFQQNHKLLIVQRDILGKNPQQDIFPAFFIQFVACGHLQDQLNSLFHKYLSATFLKET